MLLLNVIIAIVKNAPIIADLLNNTKIVISV